MLSANTTFALLTDYVTTHIMVRSRRTCTLYVSSAIKHDATSPSLVCIIVAFLSSLTTNFKEGPRLLMDHQLLSTTSLCRHKKTEVGNIAAKGIMIMMLTPWPHQINSTHK